MTITIKYFGLIADITNKKEELLSFENSPVSVESIRLQLEAKYTELQNTTYSIAINQNISTAPDLVNDNDEIALLPPFAGG